MTRAASAGSMVGTTLRPDTEVFEDSFELHPILWRHIGHDFYIFFWIATVGTHTIERGPGRLKDLVLPAAPPPLGLPAEHAGALCALGGDRAALPESADADIELEVSKKTTEDDTWCRMSGGRRRIQPFDLFLSVWSLPCEADES
eukprot:CAMPEP_0206523816 /NCGR_PEP_ID=MMETSP0324_2-20121206/67850_1 /ASSEMBLY_ACC=CAM_ASM_000836 /TAXON_ID=2866 /ORGANISM="Crypthecodinium cohnii, Strain Seligo" /LENGTH=144 /DNA_ID=CAMNT_0054018337 /DNA_START=547 /DNA_END=982 /DNA_ORIENTATION=+